MIHTFTSTFTRITIDTISMVLRCIARAAETVWQVWQVWRTPYHFFHNVAAPHHFSVVSRESMNAGCMRIACRCTCVLQVRTESYYLNRTDPLFSFSQSNQCACASRKIGLVPKLYFKLSSSVCAQAPPILLARV